MNLATKLKIDKFFFIKMAITAVLGMGLCCAYCGIQGNWTAIVTWCSAFFIAGFAAICVSLLILLESFGSFTMFSFYARRKKIEDQSRKENYQEYCKRHNVTRSSEHFYFVPFMLTGIIFVIVSLILLACQ